MSSAYMTHVARSVGDSYVLVRNRPTASVQAVALLFGRSYGGSSCAWQLVFCLLLLCAIC